MTTNLTCSYSPFMPNFVYKSVVRKYYRIVDSVVSFSMTSDPRPEEQRHRCQLITQFSEVFLPQKLLYEYGVWEGEGIDAP